MGIRETLKKWIMGEDYEHQLYRRFDGILIGRWYKRNDGRFVCAECRTYMSPQSGPGGTPLCPNRLGCKYGV